MKISIITPYYKTLKEIKELSNILSPQLNEQVEWIIIDDGCYEDELDLLPAKVIHLKENSGGASYPRNVGLNNAIGEYITFVDGDDKVSNDYISTLLEKIKTDNFDYCYFNWKCLNFPYWEIIIKDKPPIWNCSVWNCLYKKQLIGDIRFDTNLIIAEDADFNNKTLRGIKSNIDKVLYYYNNGREDSITNNYNK